jgi:hypothetical protein
MSVPSCGGIPDLGETLPVSRNNCPLSETLHEGRDSLSPKQRYIYDKHAGPLLEELAEEQCWSARAASASS